MKTGSEVRAAPSNTKVVVLGSSGFIGGRVAAAAVRRGLQVVSASRRPPQTAGTSHEVLDLSDRDALARIMSEATAVLHCVSYVGPDPHSAATSNLEGTRAILQSAARAGAPRVIYVSTASVVGAGPHRGTEARVRHDANPASPASKTRAAAEIAVADYGGTVARPNLVYGIGDRWFVPTIARLLQDPATDVAQWTAAVSTVHVDDLASALVALAVSPDTSWTGRAVFLNSPRHATMQDIGHCVEEEGLLGLNKLSERPSRVELSAHQMSLLTTDNWFSSERSWEQLHVQPDPTFRLRPGDVEWYRSFLSRGR